jgi:hypothetical protein
MTSTESRGPFLIVFGLDQSQKAHASSFDVSVGDAARKAASIMGMYALAADNAELHKVAAALPAGKVFESGSGFVPFVKRQTYDRIVEVAHAAGIELKVVPLTPEEQQARAGVQKKQSNREAIRQSQTNPPTKAVGDDVEVWLGDAWYPARVDEVGTGEREGELFVSWHDGDTPVWVDSWRSYTRPASAADGSQAADAEPAASAA